MSREGESDYTSLIFSVFPASERSGAVGIREQAIQNIRFLQIDRLRLAVPPPSQAGDRSAAHDPAEKPGHVLADVRVPCELNPKLKRFGGNIVPG